MTQRLMKRAVMITLPAVLAVGAGSTIANGQQPLVERAKAPAPAPAMFLKLDGVPGESTATGHAGEIDVEAFAFGGKNAGTTSGGGGGAGKPAFDAVRVSKRYDAASPKLFQRMATGQHIPAATFTLQRAGATVTYKLSDVTVTSYQQESLQDQVELGFAKVQITYQPATGAPVTAGWDVKLNQSA